MEPIHHPVPGMEGWSTVSVKPYSNSDGLCTVSQLVYHTAAQSGHSVISLLVPEALRDCKFILIFCRCWQTGTQQDTPPNQNVLMYLATTDGCADPVHSLRAT